MIFTYTASSFGDLFYKKQIKSPKIRSYTKDIFAPTDIAFLDEDNKALSLELYEGKAILIVFWATWCSACIKKMHNLDMLKKDFRKLQFDILPISEDTRGVQIIKDFYNNNNIKYLPILHDYQNKLMRSMGINSLPTALLLDDTGRIIYEFIGAINWQENEIRELILSQIPGEPSMPRNSYNNSPIQINER